MAKKKDGSAPQWGKVRRMVLERIDDIRDGLERGESIRSMKRTLGGFEDISDQAFHNQVAKVRDGKLMRHSERIAAQGLALPSPSGSASNASNRVHASKNAAAPPSAPETRGDRPAAKKPRIGKQGADKPDRVTFADPDRLKKLTS